MEGNTVAKIALQAATYAIDKPYDYQVPLELLDTLRPGMRVIVPFGAGNRRTEGIVLALEGGYPDDPRRKSILTVLDEEPVLDGEALRLALWMRERCSAPCTTRPGPCSRRGCTSPFRIAGSWPPAWTGRRPMRRRAGQSTPGASWSCSSPRGGRRM